MGKVLEKIEHNHLFNFVRDHNLLSALQSDFIPGDSTVNQLIDIYNTFCKSLDEGKEVRAVFFSTLAKRLREFGIKVFSTSSNLLEISDSLLLWFRNYLAERKQNVLPGGASSLKYIKAGVPQGSILGPLLFLIYINDIVDKIHSCIRLFADDISLYIIVDNPLQAATTLIKDLEKLHFWASKWLVTFNPFKSEAITFTRKRIKPLHPPLYMNHQTINEVSSHKHLGLIFSIASNWHKHIEYIQT